MDFRRFVSLWWLGLAVSFVLACTCTGAETRKVVIVTGNDYPGHKWAETAPVLAEAIRKDSRLAVDVVETPDFLATDGLKGYDVAVLHFMNWQTPDPGEQARQNLVEFTRDGGGLVAVHFACGAFQGWDEFEKLIGRVWNPNLRPHDPHGAFEVTITDANHAITRGMEPFETVDELYTCLAGETPIQVLAEAKSKVDGKMYPIAFVLEYGDGGVFHSPLGHDVAAFRNAGAAELFRRGTAWAAGLPPVPETEAKKIAFLAGAPSHGEDCHNWDEYARLVEQRLEGSTNAPPVEITVYDNAWPEDPAVLDAMDAIVFLCDGREHHALAAPGRVEKIRELARQGMGLAFLHYAVDPPEGAQKDFMDWMGGSYEPGYSQNPINTTTTSIVETQHPICRGCSGYTAPDEWYFDIRFRAGDPKLVPLMTGKLPPYDPKDKVLAWAYTRTDGGRGFGFCGGHYTSNWHNEPFRKLVLNGILWTAGADVPAGGVESVRPWRFVCIPNFVNADLAYPQPGWEETLDCVLKAIKAEDPEFVLVPGDLVTGRWGDKDSIKALAEIYYTAWVKRMEDHGLKFYAAVGDHEIGDNPWPPEKAKLAYTFKKQFQKHLGMPLNGPLRMKGTAFWLVHENALIAAVDVFERGEGPQGGIVAKVTGEQIEWLDRVLSENPGVEHVIVMGHTPVLGPVAKESSSGLMLDSGCESPLWQTLRKHAADLYLCGEVHAITCTQADGILQIAHGGLFGYNPRVNYLVATIHEDRIDLELKEIEIVNEGGRLWQMGTNRPSKVVRIPDEARQQGFTTVGTATLTDGPDGTTLTDATGCFTK